MPSIKEKILENWVLKITAIFLAVILWLFIQYDPGRVTTVTATVYYDIPDGMVLSGDFPVTVQVTIRGTSQPLSCTINLKNAPEGENTITLTEDQIKATQGRRPEVIQVNPSQIEIVLEKTIQKTVPITVPVQDDVADGFEVYEKIPIPAEVTIIGPRTHVDAIEEVPTEIIDLSGRKADVELGVSLNLEDHFVRPSFTGIVDVNLRIGPRRKMYFVKDVPISFGEGAPYLSSPKTVDIQIMAPEVFQQALVPDNFRLTINNQVLQEATLPIKVQPQITWSPEDWKGKIKIRGTDPPEVEIRRNDEASSKK